MASVLGAVGALLLPVLALLGATRRLPLPPATRFALSWALGPPLWTTVVVLLRLAGLSLSSCAGIATALAALSLVVRPPDSRERRFWFESRVGAAGILFAWGPLLLFFAAHHFEARAWDSQFQMQLASAFTSGLPPVENPFLAGHPLAYPWWLNVEVAALRQLTDLSPWHLFALTSLHGLLGTLLALALCLPARVGSRGFARLCLILAFWAPNALGWLVLVARWFTGESTGAAAIAREAEAFSRVMDQIAIGYSPRLAFPAHKWLQGGSFALIFTYLFLALHLLAQLRPGLPSSKFQSHHRSIASAVALCFAAWIVTHYMSALLCIPTILIAFAGRMLIDRVRARPDEEARLRAAPTLLWAAAAFATSLLAGAPYLWHTFRFALEAGGGREIGLGSSTASLLGLAVLLLPYGAIARLSRSGTRPDSGPPCDFAESFLQAALVAFAALGLMLDLSDHNVTKVLMPAGFLAPLLAGPALEHGWRWAKGLRRWVVRGFVSLALFGAALVVAFAVAWRDDPPLYQLDSRIDAAIAPLPRDAVLVADQFLPEEATRAAFLIQPALIGQWGFRDALVRRQGAIEALKGAPMRRPEAIPASRAWFWPDPEAMDRGQAWKELRSLGRPLIFILPRDGWSALERDSLQLVARTAEFEIHFAP